MSAKLMKYQIPENKISRLKKNTYVFSTVACGFQVDGDGRREFGSNS